MALGLILLLGIGGLLFRQTLAVTRSVHAMVTQFDPAAVQTGILDTAISDMQRGVANYLLTLKDTDLSPYVDGTRRSDLALQQLQSLLAHDDQLANATALIAEDRQQWIDTVARPTIDGVREGRVDEALALFTAQTSSDLYVSLQSHVAALAGLLKDRGEEAFSALSSLSYSLIRTVAFTLLLLGGSLVLGYVLSTRFLVRPLHDLGGQIRLVARRSDHHTRTISASGPVELVAVGRDVEELRRQLVSEIDEARSAREALEQNAPVVSAIRRELAAGKAISAPGLSIHGDLQPAEGVLAGDWWASARLHTGEAAVILADVSGHGAQAGVVAMQLKHAIQHDLLAGKDITDMARSAEEVFKSQSERFATVAAVCVDPATGQVRYINAGHHPPLLFDQTGAVIRQLERTGPVLSWLGGVWDVGHAYLGPGQSLLMYSDGLIESHDRDGEELGEEGLAAWLGTVPNDERDPAALIAWLMGAARQRAVDWSRDDVTLVAIRRNPASEPAPSLGPIRRLRRPVARSTDPDASNEAATNL